jgi:hypothetical protein
VIVFAVVVALVAVLAVALAVGQARNAATGALASLHTLRADQRHALVLARVEVTRAAGLRRTDADG